MRFATLLACVLPLAQVAVAAPFAGSNLYYAAGLTADGRTAYLKTLQSAGMKVLRVWLDGQSGSPKGTSINAFPDLEPTKICDGDTSCYNPTVLERLDDFMVAAHSFGIKLLISMHSFNALAAGDVYGAIYGTGFFYEQATPQAAFDKRLEYILNHEHTTLGKPWKELRDYIFAFEAENEAMIGKGADYIAAHTQWQCDRAQTIKNQLGSNSGILVTTGGESYLDESMQTAWFGCDALDMLAIHAYGPGDFDTAKLEGYVTKAVAAGKLLIMEEWGVCYATSANNGAANCDPGDGAQSASARNADIAQWSAQIVAAGLPWLYWQAIPNADPHQGADFEIGVTGDPSWTALQAAAKAASSASSPFDFSKYLL
ncbi:glycoside hydrolase [Epithele typhae]|uniref:glycoside hydrolase n=1 Tax=Epithele typhae TaxID=378194 RepID=UPI002007DEB4|nr:glycoside hydrolase [Epithele typhae]KAH9933245.1 glycoside hydrolase [Epithele typhae]